MDILIVWLIITPLFFAFGWLAGRIDMKSLMKQAKQVPERIFDGVDALVDNKTGLARDELQQIVSREPQLIDLQFSLGRLYRKKGENDLAIKLHTQLLASQFVINTETKEKIKLELAKDFQKAGLIDRAETTLLQLLNSELYSHQALKLLLLIYQQDKNWNEAIATARKLASSDVAYHTEVAEFNCELAQEAIIKSDFVLAKEFINKALQTNRQCVRANILLGELYFIQEQYEAAIEAWQLIEKQNYQYIPFIINKMHDAYNKLDKQKEFITLLMGYTKLYPQINLYEIVVTILTTNNEQEEAVNYLRTSMLTNKKSAKIAALLIEARLEELSTEAGKKDAERVKNVLLSYNEQYALYSCGCCNFKSKTFFWQCPACYEWESISPNT
ncbi:MAG: hypothetical protein PHC75_03925 [Burkholderiales bacterium]|nr:hypothetical protein [Burkholderiales bacterium]